MWQELYNDFAKAVGGNPDMDIVFSGFKSEIEVTFYWYLDPIKPNEATSKTLGPFVCEDGAFFQARKFVDSLK